MTNGGFSEITDLRLDSNFITNLKSFVSSELQYPGQRSAEYPRVPVPRAAVL